MVIAEMLNTTLPPLRSSLADPGKANPSEVAYMVSGVADLAEKLHKLIVEKLEGGMEGYAVADMLRTSTRSLQAAYDVAVNASAFVPKVTGERSRAAVLASDAVSRIEPVLAFHQRSLAKLERSFQSPSCMPADVDTSVEYVSEV